MVTNNSEVGLWRVPRGLRGSGTVRSAVPVLHSIHHGQRHPTCRASRPPKPSRLGAVLRSSVPTDSCDARAAVPWPRPLCTTRIWTCLRWCMHTPSLPPVVRHRARWSGRFLRQDSSLRVASPVGDYSICDLNRNLTTPYSGIPIQREYRR